MSEQNTKEITVLYSSGFISDKTHWAVARALIGGLNIHIFVLCPTNFF